MKSMENLMVVPENTGGIIGKHSSTTPWLIS